MGSLRNLNLPTAAVKRILIVDDDPELLQLVARKLDSVGFEVLSAESAEGALDLISRQGLPHLAVVDLNMPGMNGLEFCETIQQVVDLPVIMITAVSETETRLKAIALYAEDYIIKPFVLDELVVRIQRVLRRINDFQYVSGPLIEVDAQLAINFMQKQIVVAGKPIDLTPTETKMLYILWRNANRVVTTEFLLSRVWPTQEVYEDTLRVHIHRLRHKLQGQTKRESYIVTERGQGYRFLLPKLVDQPQRATK